MSEANYCDICQHAFASAGVLRRHLGGWNHKDQIVRLHKRKLKEQPKQKSLAVIKDSLTTEVEAQS